MPASLSFPTVMLKQKALAYLLSILIAICINGFFSSKESDTPQHNLQSLLVCWISSVMACQSLAGALQTLSLMRKQAAAATTTFFEIFEAWPQALPSI